MAYSSFYPQTCQSASPATHKEKADSRVLCRPHPSCLEPLLTGKGFVNFHAIIYAHNRVLFDCLVTVFLDRNVVAAGLNLDLQRRSLLQRRTVDGDLRSLGLRLDLNSRLALRRAASAEHLAHTAVDQLNVVGASCSHQAGSVVRRL